MVLTSKEYLYRGAIALAEQLRGKKLSDLLRFNLIDYQHFHQIDAYLQHLYKWNIVSCNLSSAPPLA
ncbi:MAG: hypothetical protein SAK29_29775 [Scytonema sp. PMC 1069.18]|nr:hypothetical protein [Scytonema sp. PMC 1069.18]MEC4883360.1 hypothetical protein [Scytonema sp. PMC 1070.18]